MKKFKKEKGITLVALIITIVVLLILAVVAIGAVTDSNIIKYAQKAENDYTIAQEKEQIGVAVSSYQIQKTITGDTETLFYETVKEELKSAADVTPNEDKTLTVTFNKTGNVYTVTKDGKIEGPIPPLVPEEDSITLSPTLLEIAVEEKATITATLKGSLKAEDIEWSILPEGVATIEESEDNLTVKITGVSEGRATITAKCGGKEVTCEVKVTKSQPTVQTLRAFDMTSVINQGMNITAILPPDESEFVFFIEGIPVPAAIAKEIEVSNIENIEIPENLRYKKIMLSEIVPVHFLISEDGQKIYYALPDGDGKVVFEEDVYVEVSTNIDATQYYHEQQMEGIYAFGLGEALTGTVEYVIKDGVEEDFLRMNVWQNGSISLGTKNYIPVTITENLEDFDILLNDQLYTIRKGAMKITTITDPRTYYIQDNILIYGYIINGIRPGCTITEEGILPIMKFYHTSILE